MTKSLIIHLFICNWSFWHNEVTYIIYVMRVLCSIFCPPHLPWWLLSVMACNVWGFYQFALELVQPSDSSCPVIEFISIWRRMVLWLWCADIHTTLWLQCSLHYIVSFIDWLKRNLVILIASKDIWKHWANDSKVFTIGIWRLTKYS